MDGKIRLNEYGAIVKNEWSKTHELRGNVMIDEYIIMPNHIHGITIIINCSRGTLQRAPTVAQFGKPVPNSIPTIVRLFKSATTRQINRICSALGISVWQRNYYEHIIRNEDELNRIREYIRNNPLQWQFDSENPSYTQDKIYDT